MMTHLKDQRCRPLDKDTPPLDASAVASLAKEVLHWHVDVASGCMHRTFAFKNYYQTTAFVNAVIYLAHCEDHHPDVHFGYKTCHVKYSTHSVGGLSENDFICAAKIDAAFSEGLSPT